MLSAEVMRTLLHAIEIDALMGPHDRTLIALMGYTFARASAAVQMKVEDCYIQTRHGWVRLHEKGGKVNNPLPSQPGRVFGCMTYYGLPRPPGAESTAPSSRHSSTASSWAARPFLSRISTQWSSAAMAARNRRKFPAIVSGRPVSPLFAEQREA